MHVLRTSANCSCGGLTERCPVCDWGFSICKTCGAAEVDLEFTCEEYPRWRKLDNQTWGYAWNRMVTPFDFEAWVSQLDVPEPWKARLRTQFATSRKRASKTWLPSSESGS